MISNVETSAPLFSESVEKIRTLVIGDIHMNWETMKIFEKWVNHYNTHYDLVLMTGDFGNIYRGSSHKTKLPIKIQQATEAATKAISILNQTIHPSHLLYVPGNHDCPEMLNKTLEIPKSFNVHKEVVLVAENLALIGIGGTIPSRIYRNNALSGHTILTPYDTDSDFLKDLQNVYAKAETLFPKPFQYILFSHMGPNSSPTSIVPDRDRIVHSGSAAIDELLEIKKQRFLCHIHGHSHGYEKKYQYYSQPIPIIQPGAIEIDQFGSITFKKKNSLWSIKSFHFYDLYQFQKKRNKK